MNSKLMAVVLSGALLGSMALGTGIASAQTKQTFRTVETSPRYQHNPAVYGKVTAVNGDLVTLQSARDNIFYTVDISKARVTKFSDGSAPTLITSSEVKVGDDFAAHGTLSGTTITATQARDGLPPQGRGQGLRGNCQFAN
jgi:hypothetical protein